MNGFYTQYVANFDKIEYLRIFRVSQLYTMFYVIYPNIGIVWDYLRIPNMVSNCAVFLLFYTNQARICISVGF